MAQRHHRGCALCGPIIAPIIGNIESVTLTDGSSLGSRTVCKGEDRLQAETAEAAGAPKHSKFFHLRFSRCDRGVSQEGARFTD